MSKLWSDGKTYDQIGAVFNVGRGAIASVMGRHRESGLFPKKDLTGKKERAGNMPKKQRRSADEGLQELTGQGEPLKKMWRRFHPKSGDKVFYYRGMELSPTFTFTRAGSSSYWRGHGVRALTFQQLNQWVNSHGLQNVPRNA